MGWCYKRAFGDGCMVDEGKLLLFLQEVVEPRLQVNGKLAYHTRYSTPLKDVCDLKKLRNSMTKLQATVAYLSGVVNALATHLNAPIPAQPSQPHDDVGGETLGEEDEEEEEEEETEAPPLPRERSDTPIRASLRYRPVVDLRALAKTAKVRDLRIWSISCLKDKLVRRQAMEEVSQSTDTSVDRPMRVDITAKHVSARS